MRSLAVIQHVETISTKLQNLRCGFTEEALHRRPHIQTEQHFLFGALKASSSCCSQMPLESLVLLWIINFVIYLN